MFDVIALFKSLAGLTPGTLSLEQRRAPVAVALRDGYKLQEVPPIRADKPGRKHVIETVPDFAAYLLRHLDPAGAEILASQKEIRAVSGATWDRDEVVCSLALDPTWRDWTGAFGRKTSQKDLYRFIQQHRADLVEGQADRLLGALRILEVSSSGRVAGHLDERGYYTAVVSQRGQEIPVKLPPSFDLSIPVYLASTDRYAVHVDLEINVEDGSLPTFTLSPQDLERIKVAALDTEIGRLRDLLGEAWLVTRGTLSLG